MTEFSKNRCSITNTHDTFTITCNMSQRNRILSKLNKNFFLNEFVLDLLYFILLIGPINQFNGSVSEFTVIFICYVLEFIKKF